jgi:hypothetical protein
MNSKTIKIILGCVVLILLIINLSYWVEAINGADNSDFLRKSILFWATGITFLCSFYFLVTEAKKLNNKVFKFLVVAIIAGGLILNRYFGGASVEIESKLIGVFSEPIMWLLIATLIGHFVLFIYKRNNPQMN